MSTPLTASGRILVIDEDPATAASIRHDLERRNYIVDAVTDGFSAMERLKQYRYDCVLLDLIARPGINGLTVLNFIEADFPALVAGVFIVSETSEQTVLNLAPALMSRFFRKPFDAQLLVDAIVTGPSSPPATSPGRPRALVVEDDSSTRSALTALLSEMGFDVQGAGDGRSALSLIEQSAAEPDAVFLDMLLPVFDGFTIIELFRRSRPHLLKRTIIVTGIPEPYRAQISTGEVASVLAKPVALSSLARSLESIVPAVPLSSPSERRR